MSPVNGRPVRLAPRRPGARPTIASQARLSPKTGTGAFHQSGCSERSSLAKAHQPRAQGAVARRFGLGDGGQIGGAGECHWPALGEAPCLRQTSFTQSPSGRTGRTAASAAARQWSRRRSPGSTATSACSMPRRSFSTRRKAAPAAISPMPSRWWKATSTRPQMLAELKRIEREFGRRQGPPLGAPGARPRHRRLERRQVAIAGLTVPTRRRPSAPSSSSRWPASRPAGGLKAAVGPPSGPSSCPTGARGGRASGAGGPLAQLVEQLTFNQ
jgi:hypothetical protein